MPDPLSLRSFPQKFRLVHLLPAVFLMAWAGIADLAAGMQDRDPMLAEARDFLERGDFERGAQIARAAVEASVRRHDADAQLSGLLLLAEGLDGLGRRADRVATLEEALRVLHKNPSSQRMIEVQDRLGTAYAKTGQSKRARDSLDAALKMARLENRDDWLAVVLNDLGSFQAESGQLAEASQSFSESARLAAKTGMGAMEAVSRLNDAAARIRDRRKENLEPFLADNLRLVKQLPDNHIKATGLLSVGSHYWLAGWWLGFDASWRLRAYEAYLEGLDLSRRLDDGRLASHALGSIGRLYEDEKRFDEALRYTRQAVWSAGEADATDVLYIWQWQEARILRDQDDTEGAIACYRSAIRSIEQVRTGMSQGRLPFRTIVGPVFTELADLLLRRSSSAPDGNSSQRDLLEARSTLEKLRQAEVADYFRDDCVVQSRAKTELEKVSPKAAILYPVLLPDRVEMLVSLPGNLERFTVPVTLQALTAAVRAFRKNIETPGTTDLYLLQARRLYDWLIRPLEKSLVRDAISTLVIVPDGPLRTIPISALHDGSRFLIEKYAVVTSPGLTLTGASPGSKKGTQALASGLTQSVQGFDSLPNVNMELAGIESVFPTTRLQNQDFRTTTIERKVAGGAYSIVHFATHGHFDGELENSFLVTFDGRLTMDGLQDAVGLRKYQEEALELLVLSACETASGDDRAALGLAGVGLKAGAKSVLASLWSISDESTAQLIIEFYNQLKNPANSKSVSLQAAQLALLKDARFKHPYFWAPFILIGNWE